MNEQDQAAVQYLIWALEMTNNLKAAHHIGLAIDALKTEGCLRSRHLPRERRSNV
jgi:hypothetical protein